jgi:hypothetical protein
MKYTIVYHKLGEMPTMIPYTVDSFGAVIVALSDEITDMAPAYNIDASNDQDPWDNIISELFQIEDENQDFIKYLLPNSVVIEATAIDG